MTIEQTLVRSGCGRRLVQTARIGVNTCASRRERSERSLGAPARTEVRGRDHVTTTSPLETGRNTP